MPEACMLPYNTDKKSGFQLTVHEHSCNSYSFFSCLDRTVFITNLANQAGFIRGGGGVIKKSFYCRHQVVLLKLSLVGRIEILNIKGSTLESHKLQFSKLNDVYCGCV